MFARPRFPHSDILFPPTASRFTDIELGQDGHEFPRVRVPEPLTYRIHGLLPRLSLQIRELGTAVLDVDVVDPRGKSSYMSPPQTPMRSRESPGAVLSLEKLRQRRRRLLMPTPLGWLLS